MLANPKRGEVALRLDGVEYRLRLTLGALAALETRLGCDTLAALIDRLASEAVTGSDIMVVLEAGLYGGGYHGLNLADCVVEGGAKAAARAAQELIWLGLGDGL